MKYQIFNIQTPFGVTLPAIGILFDSAEGAFEYISRATEDEDNLAAVLEHITKDISIHSDVSFDISDDFGYSWSVSESEALFCILNTEDLPEMFTTPLLKMSLKIAESIRSEMVDYGEYDLTPFVTCKPQNAYVLPSFSNLYDIPQICGDVYEDCDGVLYIFTQKVLDDFLNRADKNDTSGLHLVLKDAGRILIESTEHENERT